MALTMRVEAEVDLDEVLSTFTEEEVIKALRVRQGFRGEGVLNGFAIKIDVNKVLPALLDDLRMTLADAEKSQQWNDANGLFDLRNAIETAYIKYRGKAL